MTREELKEYHRRYANTPKRKAYVSNYLKVRRSTDAYRKVQREWKRGWRQTPNGKKNMQRTTERLSSTPEGRAKRRARIIANAAVKSGKLKQLPCEVCGNPKSQKHHDDYSKPLVVRWRCAIHHTQLHRQKEPKGQI